MRPKSYLRLSACMAAFCVPFAHADAQVAPAPTTPTGEAKADADSDIVVTGIRGSLQRAQDLKRRSPAVIEAITSEDLGKFSDQALSDSLQRVPGVQIQRNDDGRTGDKISIRGLGPQYVNVLVNDRTVVSYGDAGNGQTPNINIRNFNLDAVPTEIISGLLVYKSPLALNPESGLAGLVNIQTVRPLNYRRPKGQPGSDNLFGSVSIKGEGDSLDNVITPRFSGNIGVKLLNDTLGLFVSGVYANSRSRNNEVQINQGQYDIIVGGVTQKNVFAPVGFDFYSIPARRERRSLTGAIQWKPVEQLEINADLTYNKYANNQERQRSSIQGVSALFTGTPPPNVSPNDITIENGVVTRLAANGAGPSPLYYQPEPSRETNDTESYYGGINAVWKTDNAKFSFDYGHSEVKYFSNLQVVYGSGSAPKGVYTLNDGVPNFAFTGDLAGPQRDVLYYYGGQKQFKSSNDSFKFDAEFDLTGSFKLNLGARYALTKVDSRTAGAFAVFIPDAPSLVFNTNFSPTYSAADLAAAGRAAFPVGATASVFPQIGLGALQYGNFSAACASAIRTTCDLRVGDSAAFQGPFPTTASGTEPGGVDLSGGNSFATHEDNFAGYGQFSGSGRIFGMEAEGNIGVRVVNIRLRAQSFAQVLHRGVVGTGGPGLITSQVNTPFTDTNDYTRVLPSFNINIHPNSDSAIRFGVSRNISLPQYEDTRPSGQIVIQDVAGPGFRSNATFNNTRLKPIASTNFDLTAEYYTQNKGSIILSLFYKDIKDFVLNLETPNVTLPGQSGTFPVTGPQNVAKGTAKGFEIGINQPFSFLPSPFDGFGVQGNYTYVDSSFKSSRPEAQFGLPGASKHNANAILYYEKYGLGVRLAYTYRSSYLIGLGGAGYGFVLPTFQDGISNLDVSATYDIDSRTTILLSATNLTKAARRDYQSIKEATFAYYQRPTNYSFGIRRSF